MHEVGVHVRPAVAVELPRLADFLDHVHVEVADDQLFVMGVAHGADELAARFDESKLALEFDVAKFAPLALDFDLAIDKINAEVKRIFADKAFVEKNVTSRGQVAAVNTPEEFAAEIKQNRAAALQVVKDSGLEPR